MAEVRHLHRGCPEHSQASGRSVRHGIPRRLRVRQVSRAGRRGGRFRRGGLPDRIPVRRFLQEGGQRTQARRLRLHHGLREGFKRRRVFRPEFRLGERPRHDRPHRAGGRLRIAVHLRPRFPRIRRRLHARRLHAGAHPDARGDLRPARRHEREGPGHRRPHGGGRRGDAPEDGQARPHDHDRHPAAAGSRGERRRSG